MTKSDEFFPIVIWQSFIESILVIKRINRLGKQKIFEYYYNVIITWVKMLATKSNLITSGLESVYIRKLCLHLLNMFVFKLIERITL